jgi:hypothetical protein
MGLAISKLIISRQMLARKGEHVSYKEFYHPLWLLVFGIVIGVFFINNNALPTSPLNFTYNFIVYFTNTLGFISVFAFIYHSDYTNIWLTAYCVAYTVNLDLVWILYKSVPFSVSTFQHISDVGETINFLICIVQFWGMHIMLKEGEEGHHSHYTSLNDDERKDA